jgi:hypothetical protein
LLVLAIGCVLSVSIKSYLTTMMNRFTLCVKVLCIAAAAIPTVAFLGPSRPVAFRKSFVSLEMAMDSSNEKCNIFQTIWKRMDTLEAAGLNNEFVEHPPLMSRGGGFKRFVIIMVVGMAYKWYRARFINKVCLRRTTS